MHLLNINIHSCQHKSYFIFSKNVSLFDKWLLRSVVKKNPTTAMTAQRHRCRQNQSNRNSEITTLNFNLTASAFIPSHMTQISPEPALSAAEASSVCPRPQRAAPWTVEALSHNHHKWSTAPQPKVLNSLSGNNHPTSCNVGVQQRWLSGYSMLRQIFSKEVS